ncbi:hypothetical protein J437_LFUL011439 [Ladona fulva]|uniref:Uncharacterized protein n=1 Tax=Ladona fulva TaxID=123851 RepID=A0A8K0KDZ0_LADFU|nr:hypothetical protein J437_LFUL011439 [Ladona fulva]
MAWQHEILMPTRKPVDSWETATPCCATFCVVSKRFKKNYIHRFTATPAFFLFSPWNPVRRACIFLSTNQYFDYVVMTTILLNCVFLAMTEPMEEAE